ncbi:MAG: phasin family protein [Rhodanobacter sp.]|jgi:exonuclease VII small subunit|nr:phasin family protein [Rhodanobacter sp.]
MFDQLNTQSLSLGKNYADTFVKAQSLALSGFGRIAELNLKTFEDRMKATVDFIAQASEVRDLEAAKDFWPKGVQLAKENAEKLYANTQEIFSISLKTSEAIGALAKGSIENTSEALNKTADVAKKAIRS